MWRLTRREQQVLCVILGLLLVGWAVRTLRQTRPPPEPAWVEPTRP
ncbi:hypothetical protein [Limisphaera sp. VF-2]|jgi:hypothetical protein|nr:hypothetical protein [Limisphaera sp.]